MNPTRIITGTPSAFAVAINSHITATDAAVRINSLTMHSGVLAAVVEQLPAARHSPRSMLEVGVVSDVPPGNADQAVSELGAGWSVLAAFASKPVGKSLSLTMVAVRIQE